jgi:hypothetical protein
MDTVEQVRLFRLLNKKSGYKHPDFYLAGPEGIEPSLAVLETAVLPLNDRPMDLILP